MGDSLSERWSEFRMEQGISMWYIVHGLTRARLLTKSLGGKGTWL